MTHVLTQRILTLHKPAAALLLAALFATAFMSPSPVVAQTDVGNEQKLEGAWSIEVSGTSPGSGSGKTSGFFNRDGSVFIQNLTPSLVPGMYGGHGTGEWVRSGHRQFDLTWIYPIVSSVNGSYIGEFKDLARIHFKADGNLEGISTFKFTLADGTVQFAGSSNLKMVRVRVEQMP